MPTVSTNPAHSAVTVPLDTTETASLAIVHTHTELLCCAIYDLWTQLSNTLIALIERCLWWLYFSVSSFNADIDECAMDSGGCSHGCNDTEGSYFCSCPFGFNTLETDPLNCVGEY